VRHLAARAILSLTGYLRARPDPWLERALRMALAEFDRELAVILRDRGNPMCPGALAPPTRPWEPEFPVLPDEGLASAGNSGASYVPVVRCDRRCGPIWRTAPIVAADRCMIANSWLTFHTPQPI
jgi:hypothetical protein